MSAPRAEFSAKFCCINATLRQVKRSVGVRQTRCWLTPKIDISYLHACSVFCIRNFCHIKSMEVSKRGRTYERGSSLSIDLRRSIIDEIVLAGGDTLTGIFPGSYEQIAAKFRVARSTVRKIWRRYCEEFVETALPKAGGVQGKLSEDDLALIEALKTRRGLITMREICDELDAIGDVQESVYFSTISRSLQKLPSGKKYTRKKITHIARERLTRGNMMYTQLYIPKLRK